MANSKAQNIKDLFEFARERGLSIEHLICLVRDLRDYYLQQPINPDSQLPILPASIEKEE